MSGDGVYVSRDGLEDRFELGTPLYYILNLTIMVYGVCVFFFQIPLQNADVMHTYLHGGVNGVLYSERYSSPYHFALMFSAGRLLTFICVCMMILFRKTRLGCGSRKVGACTAFWSILLTVLIVLDVASLAILSSYYSHCNAVDAKSNPCNDRRWCAAPEVYMRDSNECPSTGPWAGTNAALTLSDMHVDSDFQWLLGLNVFFVMLEALFLLLPLALWLRSNTQERVPAPPAAIMGIPDDDALDPSMRYEAPTVQVMQLKHGIGMRRGRQVKKT